MGQNFLGREALPVAEDHFQGSLPGSGGRLGGFSQSERLAQSPWTSLALPSFNRTGPL